MRWEVTPRNRSEVDPKNMWEMGGWPPQSRWEMGGRDHCHDHRIRKTELLSYTDMALLPNTTFT